MIDCSKKSKKEMNKMDHGKQPSKTTKLTKKTRDNNSIINISYPLINTIISIQKRILHFIRFVILDWTFALFCKHTLLSC